MYKSKYFKPYELVPPEIYNSYINKDDIYELFEEDFLKTIDFIRERAGVSLIINNWFWGGSRRDSGYRAPENPLGAKKSAHKPELPKRKACAGDMISTKKSASELWAIIDKYAAELPAKIRIERTANGKPITWLHVDTNTAPTQTQKVYYFAA